MIHRTSAARLIRAFKFRLSAVTPRVALAVASPAAALRRGQECNVCRGSSPLVLALLLATAPGVASAQSWRTASREPAGLAPDPATTREAVIQVYAARAVEWRGYFGIHPWIAVKRTGATQFTVHELMGYQTRRSGNGIRSSPRVADMYWFGNRPWLLADLRGEGVDAVIDRIEAAVADYPYAGTYRIWPGPNSNTFIAHVLRAAPELRVDLPALAVGKDYVGPSLIAWTPSGTGAQINSSGWRAFWRVVRRAWSSISWASPLA